MRGELHANPHTKRAIIICCAVGVVVIVLFLGIVPLLRAPSLPVDPVAAGAASAFDVADPSPDMTTPDTRAVEAYGAGNPPASVEDVPAPVIAPVDLGANAAGNGGASASPPVVYAPAAP